MTGDEAEAAFDRTLPLHQEERQARRRRDDGGRGEGGRDGRDRARQGANARIDRARGATRPEKRRQRGGAREHDGPSEPLRLWRGDQRDGELERGERRPVRELDRGDAADEERQRRLPRSLSSHTGMMTPGLTFGASETQWNSQSASPEAFAALF